VVEQLAFNQRVAGSSPARLTLNRITYFRPPAAFFLICTFICTFLTALSVRTIFQSAGFLRLLTFVANAVYELPSFKRYGAVSTHILGGWQLNVIASFLGGTPVDVASGANTAGLALSGNLDHRPVLIPAVSVYLHNSDDKLQYLNPAAFSLPAVGRFGSLGRGSIRGPGSKNFDISVVKNWIVRKHYSLQFRAEFFNAFNHANFKFVDGFLGLGSVAADENFGKAHNPNFGRITGTQGPREIQFALKVNF
jgi:hypothetical protein